ncbi:MAG: glutathione S-transferase family protein [Sulfurifustaceae bacterium]
MKLYFHAAACSLSPHIVCRELGIPIELVEVDRKTHKTPTGENFLEVNGNGYVPVLELDDGRHIIEGPAIVQYLADLRPDAGLAPRPGTMARVRLQSWLNFVTSELHKPMAMMFSPDYAAAKEALAKHVNKRLDWLAQQLTGPYLMGESLSVADAYLFVVLNWSPWLKVELDRWPVLKDFVVRISARPKVQEALAAEGLVRVGRGEGIFYAPEALAAGA